MTAEVGQECRDIFQKMLEKDSDKRIQIQEIKVHPCFNFLRTEVLTEIQDEVLVLEKKVIQFNNGIFEGEVTSDISRHGKFFIELWPILEGEGIMKFENGDVYKGNYKDDKRSGFGVYTWSNGDTYDGEWVDDLRHGRFEYCSI